MSIWSARHPHTHQPGILVNRADWRSAENPGTSFITRASLNTTPAAEEAAGTLLDPRAIQVALAPVRFLVDVTHILAWISEETVYITNTLTYLYLESDILIIDILHILI